MQIEHIEAVIRGWIPYYLALQRTYTGLEWCGVLMLAIFVYCMLDFNRIR